MQKTKFQIIPFLYPCSSSGGIFILIFTIMGFVTTISLILPLIGIAKLLLRLILVTITYGYLFMYLRECIEDSAKGGDKAPETKPGSGEFEELKDNLSAGLGPILLCFVPALVYLIWKGNDKIFWIILSTGYAFYPMAVMRYTMTGVASSLWPHNLIWPILKLLFPYFGLLIGCGIVLAFPVMFVAFGPEHFLFSILFYPIFAYFTMMIAHMIGRFYLYHAAQLDWE